MKQKAYARKRGLEPLPLEGIEALTELFGGACAYCPAVARTWDHLVAVSKGGKTQPGNIVPACVSCNSRKRNLDVLDFIAKYNIPISSALEGVLALGYEWGQHG